MALSYLVGGLNPGCRDANELLLLLRLFFEYSLWKSSGCDEDSIGTGRLILKLKNYH